MQFALLYRYDPTVASPTEAEIADWMTFDEKLRAADVFVHEAGFHGRDEGRVVRVRDGATVVEQEHAEPAAYTVAGYYVVDVVDVDAATEIAAQIPTATYGYVEVRQVVDFTG
jgi:hypothetical protein